MAASRLGSLDTVLISPHDSGVRNLLSADFNHDLTLSFVSFIPPIDVEFNTEELISFIPSLSPQRLQRNRDSSMHSAHSNVLAPAGTRSPQSLEKYNKRT